MTEWWEEQSTAVAEPNAYKGDKFWLNDSEPVSPSQAGLNLPDDPAEQDRILREVLDTASELEISIPDSEHHYHALNDKPAPQRPLPPGYMGIRAAPPPTKWQRFKNFFISERPALPADADRADKFARALDVGLDGPLRTFFKLSKGMTLGAPDLMWAAVKRSVPEDIWADEVKNMTLDEAMDWAGGYNPSGFQKTIGEMAEFVGRIHTVAPIARKIGVIGNTPKDVSLLIEAGETAKLFGIAGTAEQISKLTTEKIDPTEAEYGYEGPKAVLRDMAIGAIFGMARFGIKGIWKRITPSEEARIIKILGLKKGASLEEIENAAREFSSEYQPGTIETLRNEFVNAIKQRVKFLREGDVVFRGQKVKFTPKMLEGESAGEYAIRTAKVERNIAEEEAQQKRHMQSIAAEGKGKVGTIVEEARAAEAAERVETTKDTKKISDLKSEIAAREAGVGKQTISMAKDQAAKSGKNRYIRNDAGKGKKSRGWFVRGTPPKSGDYFTVTPNREVKFGMTAEAIEQQRRLSKHVEKAIERVDKTAKEIGAKVTFERRPNEPTVVLDMANPNHRNLVKGQAEGITDKEIDDYVKAGNTFEVTGLEEVVDLGEGQIGSKITLFGDSSAEDVFHEFTHAVERQGVITGWKGTAEEHARYMEELFRQERESELVEFGKGKRAGPTAEGGAQPTIKRRTPEGEIVNVKPDTEPAPIFYSKLQRAVEAKMPNKMEAGAFKSWAKKQGIKDEEMLWMGVDELIAKGEPVTKQQVLDTIAANDIKIEEVVKGGKTKQKYDLHLLNEQRREADRKYAEMSELAFDAIKETDSVEETNKNSKLIEKYLEGNLDEQIDSGIKLRKISPDFDWTELKRLNSEINRIGAEQFMARQGKLKTETQFSQYTLPGGENYREVLMRLPESKDVSIYKSPHWSETNVLAHFRIDDRTDKAGNKILFIEEIQSDWHQKGRERGYQLKKGDLPDKPLQQVPNAPFKTTWAELAFKRILRMAAEEGYDKVAWTTGEQQAERYPNEMRKVVDKIKWGSNKEYENAATVKLTKNGQDVGTLFVNRKTGIVEETMGLPGQIRNSRLSGVIGGKMADQILRQESGEIGGEDFVVGNKGMWLFYDQILPTFAKKYTKKWGVKGVGEAEIQVGEDKSKVAIGEYYPERLVPVHAIPVTDKMVESVMGGQVKFDIKRRTPEGKLVGLGEEKTPQSKVPRMMSGFDPGIDKFIAEDVVPAVKGALEAVRAAGGVIKAIGHMGMDILEPARAAKKKAGTQAYVNVIKAVHKATDVARLEFEQTRIDNMDMNVAELRKWFDKFSKEDNKNFVTAFAGQPGTPDAARLQKEAFDALPAELQNPSVIKAVRQIAEQNYKDLKEVAEGRVGYVQDYFYGVFKNPEQVARFIDYWKSTEKFLKHKNVPSLADAIMFGLEAGKPIELRQGNYIDNLMAERLGIARLGAMRWLRDELLKDKGVLIDNIAEAPMDFEPVHDPVFDAYRVMPELANLINKQISANKVTQQPALNAIRKLNNSIRVIKFYLSLFHQRVIIKAAMADSGYLGFINKKTSYRWLTLASDKKWQQVKQQPEYKRLIELGLGYRYSLEEQAMKSFDDFVNRLDSGNYIGATGRLPGLGLWLTKAYPKWLFEKWIPMVKYAKVLDAWQELEAKTGRQATDAELIDIIKETQNFYGEMNERLFGRSGTATTVLRFFFQAPGFAEGNYRTNIKALSEWGIYGQEHSASRSRANILNSLIITGITATVGTLIFTRRPPKKPETVDDIHDLFKVDTGKTDARGRRIMIDMLDYDKDYFNLYFNLFRGRPDEAIVATIKRIGGMKAPFFDTANDLASVAMGKALYDWKGDRVVQITDPWTEKLAKIVAFESRKFEPISYSVFQQAKKKHADGIWGFLESVSGFRPTISEKDKRESQILQLCWSLKGQKEETYIALAEIQRPREAVDWYNKRVHDVLDGPLVPQEVRNNWMDDLIIDLDKFLQNKTYEASLLARTQDTEKTAERAAKILKNFKISPDEAVRLKAQRAQRLRAERMQKKYQKTPEILIQEQLSKNQAVSELLANKRLTERMKEP